jgi:hypothetical protein
MRRPLVGIALSIGLAAGIAMAGPAGGPLGSAKKDVKEARQDLKEARKNDGGPAAIAAAAENLKAAQQKLHDSRVDRRKNHIEEMRTKWKAAIDRADVRDAMRIHARREARLHRMKVVATELGKTDAVTRIDGLITKEQARFDKKMSELQGEKK